MRIKDLTNALICGAASALGSIIVTKGVQYFSDPVNRAEFKKRLKNIKNKFIRKTES